MMNAQPLPANATRDAAGALKPLAVPINEGCRLAGIGRTTCYGLIGQGRLKTVAIGRRKLIVYSSLEALLQPAA